MSGREDGTGIRRFGEAHFISIFFAFIAYLVLSDLCEDRPSCSVLASPETFTENPCIGTSKYLEVHYKCSPNDFEELTVCEGEDMDIGCHKGNRIAVFAAMFGRRPNGTAHCRPYKQGYIDCQATGTISEVRNRCHSRKRCSLLANASVFGDPCAAGIHKYLTVSYACVPKEYLKQLHRKSGRRKKKRRRKKKKKKKKKKRKGLDKLLPMATPSTTTTTRLVPESPFDNLYETYEKEDITHAGRRPFVGETSTTDLVLNNIFSSPESAEEVTPNVFAHENHTFPPSTDSPLITTIYNAHLQPDTSNRPHSSSEETSTDSQPSTTTSHHVPERETQELFSTNQMMSTTMNPKFIIKEESKDENGTTVGKYDVGTDNWDGEEVTSQTPSQSMTVDVSTSLEVETEVSSIREDLSRSNLKTESNTENDPYFYGESEQYDREDNYGRVKDNFSLERTSVASNPTTLDRRPKDQEDIKSNIQKQDGAEDDREKATDQKPVLVIERNVTVSCPNNSEIPTDIRWRGRQRPRDVRTIGFLEDWFSTWYFLQQHEEKAWLYFTLGVCFGIIVLLIIILIKVCISFRRNIRARLDVSEPTHRSAHVNNHSSLDAPMLEHSDSIDRIEFVQFHPRGTLRSMRSSNSHNRDIVNYYG